MRFWPNAFYHRKNYGAPKGSLWWKKIRVSEKIWGGRKKYIFNFFAFSRKTFAFPRETLRSLAKLLRSLAKLLRSLAKIFAFPRKTFAFSRKIICVPSQNICVLSQNYLRSLAKLLRSLAKPAEFGQTLPVYFTACSGLYSSISSQWSGS